MIHLLYLGILNPKNCGDDIKFVCEKESIMRVTGFQVLPKGGAFVIF